MQNSTSDEPPQVVKCRAYRSLTEQQLPRPQRQRSQVTRWVLTNALQQVDTIDRASRAAGLAEIGPIPGLTSLARERLQAVVLSLYRNIWAARHAFGILRPLQDNKEAPVSLPTSNLRRPAGRLRRRSAFVASALLACAALPGNAQEPAAGTANNALPGIYETLLSDDVACPIVVEPATAEPDDEVILCGKGFTDASSIEVAGQAVGARFVDAKTLAFTIESELIRSLLSRRLLTVSMTTGTFPILVDGSQIGSITLDISSLVG